MALVASQHTLDDTFLMMNGDVLTTLDYSRLIAFHREKHGILTIAMHTRQQKIDLGVMRVNDSDEVTHYIEKPKLDYQVSMGIYVFEPAALRYVKPETRLDFNDLVLRLLDYKERVIAYPSHDIWLDIGRHDDYQEATSLFIERRSDFLKEGPA
jgi:NDP-sugar pyrophosphorylase family protein